jgi:hypothetical protein
MAGPASDFSTELPLDDFRWVMLDIPHRWLTERVGNPHFAAEDLTRALATPPPHGVRTMRRYLGRFRDLKRPDVEREQLPFSFWTVFYLLAWSDGLRLGVRNRGVDYPVPLFGTYAWKPDLVVRWPEMFAPVAPVSAPTSRSRRQQAIRQLADRVFGEGKWENIPTHTIMAAAKNDLNFQKQISPFPDRSTFERALNRKKY